MSVYRFHIRDASGLIEDEEGVDLPDLAAVFRHALESARGFSEEAPLFEIADSTGRTVLTVPIFDLTISKRPIEGPLPPQNRHAKTRARIALVRRA